MAKTDAHRAMLKLAESAMGFPPVLSVVEEPGASRIRLAVAADLSWFAGHFPEFAVLPGIVQLHWATLVCRSLYGFEDVPVEIRRLKFKKVVTPPRELELTVCRRSKYQASFSFSSPGEQNSEGTLVFWEAS